MKKSLVILATVTTVTTMFAAARTARGDASTGTATNAATQQAACDTAASSSGITGTNTGTAGTGASSSSSSTGTSTNPLTASSNSTSTSGNPSVTNCPNCPPDLGTAVSTLLSPNATTTTTSTTAMGTTAANPVCDPSLDAFCISTSDPNAGSGNPLTPITKLLPSQGIIAIGPKTGADFPLVAAQNGQIPPFPLYIFYDGNPDDISPLGGYLGINGNDVNFALLGLVASTDPNDNFNRLGGNVPLLGNLLASLALMADQAKAAQATQNVNQLLPGLSSQGVGTSPVCDPNDLICLSTHDATAGTGNPLAPITRILPSQGIVALGPYNPDTGQTLIFTPQGIDLSALYLFYDGEPYDIDPLGGYLGLNGHDFDIALLGLVASLKNTDNFNRAGGNLPIIGYPTTPLTNLSPILVRSNVIAP